MTHLSLSISDAFFEQLSVDTQVAKLLFKRYKCDADDDSIMKVMMLELHRLEAAFSSYIKTKSPAMKTTVTMPAFY